MVNYNQAYLESLVKPGSTRLSILVDNCQKPGKSGSTRVYQAHQAFNQTFGARDLFFSLLPVCEKKTKTKTTTSTVYFILDIS